ENKQDRFGHEAAADRQHLLLAAREAAGPLCLPFGETREDAEDALAILPSLIARAPISPKIEIVPDAQIGKDAAAFWHMNEATRDDACRLLSLDHMSGKPD